MSAPTTTKSSDTTKKAEARPDPPPYSSSSADPGLSTFGLLLMLSGIALAIWIESWAVQKYQRLDIGLHHVIPLDVDSTSLRDQLVYFSTLNYTTASISATPPLQDSLFRLTLPNAVKLMRKVEIYQWVERKRVHKVQTEDFAVAPAEDEEDKDRLQKKKKRSKNAVVANQAGQLMTKYHYEQKWMPAPVDDAHFRRREGHRNVGTLPLESETVWTKRLEVHIGKLTIQISHPQFLQQLDEMVHIPLNGTLDENLPPDYQLQENSLFYRTSELVPEDDSEPENEAPHTTRHDDDNDKTKIIETTYKVDGEETTLYQVVATGESFSSRELAEQGVLMQWVKVETLNLDGTQRTLYQVEDERYSSHTKALEHAARLQQQWLDTQAQLPAAQRYKKYKFLPQIGDVRVQFWKVPVPANLSAVGQLIVNHEEATTENDGQSFRLEPWILLGSKTKQGIALMSSGYHTPEDLFAKAQKDTVFVTWMARFGAWLVGMIGTVFLTQFGSSPLLPMVYLVLVAPTKKVLGMWGANLILPLVNGLLAASLVWIRTRSDLGLAMGVMGGMLMVGIRWAAARRPTKSKTE